MTSNDELEPRHEPKAPKDSAMTDERFAMIEKRLEQIEGNQNLCINYMREIARLLGARANLEAIDAELAELVNAPAARDTDPAPAEDSKQ